MAYLPTIGLEIHAELSTKTKMFCSCKNNPDEEKPNVNVCPICMGHPGTLPVINKKAVESILKVGLAVNGRIATTTEFDRKNYFYPDIPKGYQISQYKYPLVSGGELAGVQLTRVHLEEDTGTSVHDSGDFSLVNFNRAGVPLMELVTEPCIHSGEEAAHFAKELQLLLQYLGVAEANMEKGEMRVEVNISVSDSDKFGTKVEIKNLNSFKVAQRAIEYEIKRQTKVLEEAGGVTQETRGWNEARQETFSQRVKEDSHDYRYFPDPDLPKMDISKIVGWGVEDLKSFIPETPIQKRIRFGNEYGIKEADIEFYINSSTFSNFLEAVVLPGNATFNQLASNYIVSDLASKGDTGRVEPSSFRELMVMLESNEISSRGAKDTLAIMFEKGGGAKSIATEHNLIQISDTDALRELVEDVINKNSDIAKEYRAGKQSAIQFLVGQGMKMSKGGANPAILKTLLEQKLK